MRRLVITGAILAALVPAAAASATTPPEPTDPASEATIASDTAPSEGAEEPVDEVATVYDDSGNAIATIT